MTLRINVNTFVKIAALNTSKQFSEIDKLVNSNGGYDFYHSLKATIRNMVSNEDLQRDYNIIGSLSNQVERSHNESAAECFEKWVLRKKRTYFCESERKSIYFRAFDIEIWCEPIFISLEDNTLSANLIWATKTPSLNPVYAGMAIYLAKEIFSASQMGNHKFGMLDVSGDSPRYHTEKRINDLTEVYFQNDLANIARIAKVQSNLVA